MLKMSGVFLQIGFSKNDQGKLLNTYQRELAAMGDTFSSIGVVLTNLVSTIVYSSMALYVSWQLTLTFILSGLLFYLPIKVLGKLNISLEKKELKRQMLIHRHWQKHWQVQKLF